MEVLIFGSMNFIAWGLLIVVTGLPFLLVSFFGLQLGLKIGRRELRWILPALLFFSVIAWVVSSYYVFERDCELVVSPTFFDKPNAKPIGFIVYKEDNSIPELNFEWTTAIERGYFKFVNTDIGRECAEKENYIGQYKFNITNQCSEYSAIRSEFSVKILSPVRLNHWWYPPIYSVEMQVKEDSTGKIFARATELIFGGGLLGIYMKAFGGDQDYARLSCGYVSHRIGPFRPSLSTRPRAQEYQEADLTFLRKALEPN